MAANFPFSNPIAYAHLQLRGGWKNLLLTVGAYALVLGTVIIATVRMNPGTPATTALAAWTSILLVFQLGIFLLFGCATVCSALRTDTASRMIESHRLMPVHPGWAVFGYLLGAESQILAMAAATFLLGLITNLGAGSPPMRWIVPNLILAVFAAFVWLVMLFASFINKSGPRVITVLTFIAFTTQGMILFVLPGLTVLVSPLIGDTIFARRAWGSGINQQYAIAMAAQCALGAILFIGAARKYRRPEAPAFGTLLALIFLAAWVAVSAVGIDRWEEFQPRFQRDASVGHVARFLFSLAVTMLLALVPVAASVRADADWRRRRRLDDPAPMRRPFPPVLAVLFAAAVALALLPVAFRSEQNVRDVSLRTAATVLFFLLFGCYLLRIVYRGGGRGLFLVGLLVILTWVAPFIIDLIRHAMTDAYDDPVLGMIMTFSPLGLLIELWDSKPMSTTPGLAFQAALAALAALLYYAGPLLARRTDLSKAPKPL